MDPIIPRAIVRVKRKRNEEPLEAFVYESESTKRRKFKSGVKLFRLAETIEDEDWTNSYNASNINDRIAAFKPDDFPGSSTSSSISDMKTSSFSNADSNPRLDSKRKYNAVLRELPLEADRQTASDYPAPPQCVSTSTSVVAVYDAVPDLSGLREDADSEMTNLGTVLLDYLQIANHTNKAAFESTPNTSKGDDDSSIKYQDYVWDVYYSTSMGSLEWASNPNFAIITGLPLELQDLDSSDEDSEIQDEADEDSNAEDWYMNDYPEDEDSEGSSDNDDFSHEASEEEDDNATYGRFQGRMY